MMAEQPKSRLDRELDEILAKKSKEPIAFRSHQKVKQQRSGLTDWQLQAKSAWKRIAAIPLLLAFMLVIVAMLVHGFSPLLALVLSTGAVAAILVPAIRGVIRPSMPSTTDVKYWRGRPYTTEIKSAVSRSPIDSIKRYFDRHR